MEAKSEIKFENSMSIGSIGGSKIVILSKTPITHKNRLSIFSSLAKAISKGVAVSTAVEGDEIAIECVRCQRVTGKVVAIGGGCEIDPVQYSETFEIAPDATVEKIKKI